MEVKRAFWIFAILTVLTMIADRILFVIFPNYLLRKDFSATEIGLIFSIASFIILVSKTFIGKLSDAFGRKRIMSLGLFIQSISVPFYPIISKLHEFSIVKGLQEISGTLTSSVEDAIKADVFKKKIRAKILAKLGTIFPLSRALASVIGFLVVTYFSLIYGFYVAAFVLFLSFLVFFIFFKENGRKIGHKPKFKLSIKSYSKSFKIITIIGFLISINFTAAYFPGFFILANNLGITESLLFLLLFGDYLISSVFAYWSGRWIDKFGRVKTVFIGCLVFSTFIILYPFSSSIAQFFLILLGVSISYYIWRIVFKTVLMDSTIKKVRGEQIGFSKTIQGIGDMIGPVIGGFLIDTISLSSAFFFAGFVGLISAIFAYYLK